ncbi:MAG: isoprenyl transferase [Phototrophicales bacterium]|nr:MAG: isoprenyl transferase [Phototrophicales bacterium]
MVAIVQDHAPMLPAPLPPEKMPRHVAIIMDGNGRWAKARGLPRAEGHRHGTENLRRILNAAGQMGIKIMTIYAFSTENWGRPPAEVQMLMRILETVIERELMELHQKGVQLRHIGELDGIPARLQRKIRDAMELTHNNDKLILNIAFNYGGRDEIVRAVRHIVEDGVPVDRIDEKLVSSYLYTGDLPDPDLIIRTSGELRVSNFLIWQGAYSELYSTPIYWPDFDENALREAILEYGRRKRRFGKTDEQIEREDL